jgi:hypothetical protein
MELTGAIWKLANNLVNPLGCHPERISSTELDLLADPKSVRRHRVSFILADASRGCARDPRSAHIRAAGSEVQWNESLKSKLLWSTFLIAGNPN